MSDTAKRELFEKAIVGYAHQLIDNGVGTKKDLFELQNFFKRPKNGSRPELINLEAAESHAPYGEESCKE